MWASRLEKNLLWRQLHVERRPAAKRLKPVHTETKRRAKSCQFSAKNGSGCCCCCCCRRRCCCCGCCRRRCCCCCFVSTFYWCNFPFVCSFPTGQLDCYILPTWYRSKHSAGGEPKIILNDWVSVLFWSEQSLFISCDHFRFETFFSKRLTGKMSGIFFLRLKRKTFIFSTSSKLRPSENFENFFFNVFLCFLTFPASFLSNLLSSYLNAFTVFLFSFLSFINLFQLHQLIKMNFCLS